MAKSRGVQPEPESVVWEKLEDLHLDKENPRLGGRGGVKPSSLSETAVLDIIVEQFGIDDVLSSIAVNGYFKAEPIIGVKQKNGIVIREGNRRLAACLILAGDPRAKNHEKRTRQYQEILSAHGHEPIKSVPVLVYNEKQDAKKLLSYLGVRHIAAALPWDSYAKAAWVARVLESGKLTLGDVGSMIGDHQGTVARMLEGFYFVSQLIESGRFNPKDSMRAGRGSNPEYPFSWVYTLLGYKTVRNWLSLKDIGEGSVSSTPIEKGKLDDAAEALIYMFGNKSKNRAPVINDSRELSDLAVAVSEPARRTLLKRGKSIKEVIELSKPTIERITEGLYDAQDALTKVLVPLSQGEVSEKDALLVVDTSKKVKKLASDVDKKIFSVAKGDSSDVDE